MVTWLWLVLVPGLCIAHVSVHTHTYTRVSTCWVHISDLCSLSVLTRALTWPSPSQTPPVPCGMP